MFHSIPSNTVIAPSRETAVPDPPEWTAQFTKEEVEREGRVSSAGESEKVREIAPPLSAVHFVKEELLWITIFEAEFNLAEMAAPFPLPDVFVIRATSTSRAASTPSAISIREMSVCASVLSESDCIAIVVSLNDPLSTLKSVDVSFKSESDGITKSIVENSTVPDEGLIVKTGRFASID